MANQLVRPNLEIIEKAGLCLQFTKRSFGIFTAGTNAWDEWLAAKRKHEDRNFPADVYVPVFFDWSGWVMWSDGVSRYGRYGHVAYRAPDGKIWSSPLSGTGRAWFASVDDLARSFGGGMKYVGWSEDISGVEIITEGGSMNTQEEIGKLWEALNSTNQDKDRLWSAVDQTNKNVDVVKLAAEKLASETKTPINLEDYELQLVKKER